MLLSVEQDRESGFDRDSEIPTMARFSLSLSRSRCRKLTATKAALQFRDWGTRSCLGCDREWLGFHTLCNKILEFERVQVIVVMFHACLVLEILIL